MAGGFVHLEQVGGLSTAGRGYQQDADDSRTRSAAFRDRMEQARTGLQGQAGRQFAVAADAHAGNLVRLGQQFAEQALRVVRGEQAIVAADRDSARLQHGVATTVADQASTLSRPINS